MTTWPTLIQGGMGVGVSDWRLARAVATQGQLGVVSGTALDIVIARRLQLGDACGSVRRALSHFPWPEMAQRVRERFFVPGGKPPDRPFAPTPLSLPPLPRESVELMVVANFVEVFLARDGHDGTIGINYLTKIQLPTLPSLFGAMLAGVGCVLMGAGIPVSIPGSLDRLAAWKTAEIKLDVVGSPADAPVIESFDPNELVSGHRPDLTRPAFFGIVSSETVARTLARRATGAVDGFVFEHHSAGGHNAPPRRAADGDAMHYGERDAPNFAAFRKLGKPFWIAGGQASPEGLRHALSVGAHGVQVGSAFAYCSESGTLPELKRAVLEDARRGALVVQTDFRASPTGYPFKLVPLEGTIGAPAERAGRRRLCDLGYLRQLYVDDRGRVRGRCPGEPEASFVAKGGDAHAGCATICLCNGLLATIGLGQVRRDGPELPVVTAGEDFAFLPHVQGPAGGAYSARDVIAYVLGG